MAEQLMPQCLPTPVPAWLLSRLVRPRGDDQVERGGNDPSRSAGLAVRSERRYRRARAYLATIRDSIQGEDGSKPLWMAACKLVGKFQLPREVALDLLASDFNPRCKPPWSKDELTHAVERALTEHRETPVDDDQAPHVSSKKVRTPMKKNDNAPNGAAHTLVIERMDQVKIAPVKWLAPGFLPWGTLTLIDGDPGTNKSTLTLAIAAAVTTGQGILFGQEVTCHPSKVLLVAPEDSASTTIAPRLFAAGADLARVGRLTSVKTAQGELDFLDLEKHLPALRERLKTSGIRVVIIDPLMAFLGAKVKNRDEQAVRRLMLRLAELAEESGIIIIGIRHLNKGENPKALYRGTGSIGFSATARSVLLVAYDAQTGPRSGWRVVAQTKANLAADQGAYRFHVAEKAVPCADSEEVNRAVFIDQWQKTNLTADSLLTPAQPVVEGEAQQDQQTRLQEACELIPALLADGPRKQTECMEEGKALGISESTMHRARRKLGVKSKKVANDDGTHHVWHLMTS